MSSTVLTGSKVQIRLATSADAPSISSVLFQSFSEYKTAYTTKGFAATTPDVEQIENRITEGPVWIALRDGKVVGTVSALLQGDSLYVRGMAVLPSARGHRIGELLMEKAESFASAQKCRRILLSTTPFLGRAIALYERLGFNRLDDSPHDLYGTPLFTMEKRLDHKDPM